MWSQALMLLSKAGHTRSLQTSSAFQLFQMVKKQALVLLTCIYDKITANLRLPVIPGGLKSFGKADAEVFEVSLADQRLRGAGGDQRAFDGQHER